MPTQRDTILQQLQADLKGIQRLNGFHFDVATVFLGNETLRQFNLSDMPLIIISDGADVFQSETFGNMDFNDQKRVWALKLVGILAPGGSADDIRSDGESFLEDIRKRMFAVRSSDVYKNAGIFRFLQLLIQGPNAFQTAEYKQARVEVNLQLYYHFRAADL